MTEINFGQRVGAGRGRTQGVDGCAAIYFGRGWRKRQGDRNKLRSTGRGGAGAKTESGGSGATEMNCGQRAGAGRGRRPDRCRFFGSLCVPSPVSGIRMPNPPFSPCGRRGLGGRGAKPPEGAGMRCMRARRPRSQGVQGCATRSRAPASPDACSDRPVPHQGAR